MSLAMSRPTLDDTLLALRSSRIILTKCPSSERLCRIALIVDDWKVIGRLLNLTRDEINEVDEDNEKVVRKKIGMLDRWWQKNATKATYLRLAEAFYAKGRTDLIERLVDHSNQDNTTLVPRTSDHDVQKQGRQYP